MRAHVLSTLSFLLAAPVLAQDKPKDPPTAQPAEPAKDDVLSGPKVKETVAEKSLVRRNFQGRVQRLEVNPAEAAIELLSLDAATAAKVKKVVGERTQVLDRIVRENLDLLLKIQNTADRRGKIGLLREAREKFKDLEARGKLQEEVAKVLPAEQAKRYEELIKGYWETLLADAEQEAGAGKEKPAKSEIATREVLLAFGAEIRRSYERQIASKTKELEEFLGKLGLSAEKEAKIRNFFVEYAERTKGRASEQQRRDLFQKVLRELDRDQQKIVLDEVLGKARPAGPTDEGEPMRMDPMKDDGEK